MQHPGLGPKFYSARSVARYIALLIFILFSNLQGRLGKSLQQWQQLTHWKPINRSLAQFFQWITGIARQNYILRVAVLK